MDDFTFVDVNIEGLERKQLVAWSKHYGLKANDTSKAMVKELAKKQKVVRKFIGDLSSGGGKSAVQSEKAPKLEDAPKLEMDQGEKVETSSYKIWRREVNEWRTEFSKHYNEKILLINVMKAVPKKLKLQVYAELPEGTLKLDAVLKLLDRDHLGLAVVQDWTLRADYRSIERGHGELLSDFVLRFRQTRAKALQQGLITPSKADVHDLLAAVKLDEATHAAMLRSLKSAVQADPEVDQLQHILSELQTLEEMQGMRDVTGRKTEQKAFFAGKGQPHGEYRKPDWDCPSCGARCFGSKDYCFKCQTPCPDGGGKGFGGKGSGGKFRGKGAFSGNGGKSYWGKKGAKGKHKGKKGAKAHGKGAWQGPKKSIVKEEPGGKDKDWKCEKCGFMVFGKRQTADCPKCGAARPKP